MGTLFKLFDMRNIILIFVSSLFCLSALKAECTFQSFAVGEEFTIGNMLVWTTTDEVDNKLFVIEKSVTGEAFEAIGEVKGSGSSDEETTYRFMDLDARKGVSYYRIKQVDFDSDFNYSQIVVVNKESANDFVVSSINSPLDSDQVELTIDFVKPMELTYSIKDMKGDLLQEDMIMAEAGLQNISFDLSSYPNGSYRLFLESGEEIETITIRKTKSEEDSKVPVAIKE